MAARPLFEVPVPNPFTLELMVLSHGWVDLSPFRWDRPAQGLDTVIRTRGDRAFALRIKSEKDGKAGQRLRIFKQAGPRPAASDLKILEERIAWCFRLDEDFSPFQERCASEPGLEWIAKHGLGPFLRNPDLFEEFAKILFTTNINWAGTRSMNDNVLKHLGQRLGKKGAFVAFPTAGTCAARSEKFFREKIRLGYRAPFFRALGERFAGEAADLERLKDPERPLPELAKELSAFKGFGPYSVHSLLITFSRYEHLILDSWIRKMVSRRHFKGRRVSDAAIRRHYASWGQWAGLACWFECAYDTWFREELKARE